MKSFIFGLILCLCTLSVYAAPPYIGVSAGENLAFTNQSCLSVSQKVLKKDGFKKLALAGDNVFAAFNRGNNYQYKAMVRCMETQNTFVIVVVANSTKTIKAKAHNLRLAIQKHFSPVTATQVETTTSKPVTSLKVKPSYANNSAKTWQDSLLGRGQCLERAETALRNSGFARNFEIDYEKLALSGLNENAYQGIVRCLPDQQIILFKVFGKSAQSAKSLLEILQLNF